MALSKRATGFLQRSERVSSILTEADIRQTFIENGVPEFEPLIEFQKQYGGYIFYAGLAPIKFSLLKGEGGYPKSSNTTTILFEESGSNYPKYFFDCASTKYQMQFFLDELGNYYEDYEAKASSFEKSIEHLALWDEIRSLGNYELIFRDRRLQTDFGDKELGLDIVPEASDQFTLWFKNDVFYMQQWQGLTTLFGPKEYSKKDSILAH